MTAIEVRAAVAIGLLFVVRMLGLFMVLPVLPLVAPELPGATPLLVGLALGIYGLSQACLQIPLGLLSDRIGRKQVIIGGLLIFVIGSVVAALADSVAGIIAGRFLQGCGAIASTLLALASDVTRIEHRSKAMAVIGVSVAGSFGLALILGPLVAQLGGLSAIFWFCAASALIGMVVLWRAVPTPSVHSRNPEALLDRSKLGDVLRHPGLVRTTLGVFFLHYLLMSSFILLPPLLEQVGVARDQLYLYYFWLLLASFVAMLPFIYIADRRGLARPMLLVMIAVFCLASLSFALNVGYYPVLVTLVFFFMAFNLLEAVLPAMVSKLAPAGYRGTAMGVFSTAQFGGGFVGGLVGGMLLMQQETTHLMYVNAAICGFWFLATLGMPAPGNFRTVTCRWSLAAGVGISEVAEELLSVPGVVDVAVLEQEQLAYLKVDSTQWNDAGLDRLGFSAEPVS